MLLYVLSLVALTIQSQNLNTSKEKVQHQINAAIKFMCTNQNELNGEFLHEPVLHKDSVKIDTKPNNMARQSGGLYAIAMYYRLNRHQHNDAEQGFSITECIHHSIRYIQNMSVTTNDPNTGTFALVDGSTGATALSLLGMIEICVIDRALCGEYSNQFLLWIQGLITMRQHKLTNDRNILTHGAFSKKVKHLDESTAYYDSESYLALSRLLQHKKHLLLVIKEKDMLWNTVQDIVNGLDEYYIQYRTQSDAHWLIQAWFTRWIVLNSQTNNFMNHYMVSDLMKPKLEAIIRPHVHMARCHLMEAVVDVIDAIQITIDTSQYTVNASNPLRVFRDLLWDLLQKRYVSMTANQLFDAKVNFYFESRFDGGFVGDRVKANDELRIDNTQHCVIALMKIQNLLFMNDDYNGIVMDDDALTGGSIATSYDVMISAICLVLLILLVNVVFFYWCYYYPKEQKQRNDLFWMGQTMDSAPSDINMGDQSDVL
eukprot:1102143_1